MTIYRTQTDGRNKYVDFGLSIERCLEICGEWEDKLPLPLVHRSALKTVIDDSWTGIGTKGRWADLLVSQVAEDELVYVQPRCGWAGISLSALAQRYGKKLTLFMPASAKASEHQLVCIERGASPIFVRIAAMPNLNAIARAYALERGAYFIPFGLDHPTVVAAGVSSTLRLSRELLIDPLTVWSVISTGVLTRTLQIAWPNAKFHGVAVARNLHDGEVGSAQAMSYHKSFTQPADLKQAFLAGNTIDSAVNYDMKGLEYFLQSDDFGLFWNVAGNVSPKELKPEDVDSRRDWGERR